MSEFKYFKNKKVLITGHTGFKGSWLTMCLNFFESNILGLSKDFPTSPSHYKICKELKNIAHKRANICKKNVLLKTINSFKPNFIFHLAAQPLVSESFINPLKTWNSNTIGTIQLLEALKRYEKKVIVVIITSDKVYFNYEKKSAYKETDRLGGKDPYSASKASAEIAIKSYFETYLKFKKNIRIGIARAGNVIGGGDWSGKRLIPDCVKAWSKNKYVSIRNLQSTRPWQHVLEVINGYMMLAIKLNKNKNLNGQAFNFGPNYNFRVIDCLNEFKRHWSGVRWRQKKRVILKEASLLRLNSKKAFKILGWNTVLNFEETIKLTAEWYKNFYGLKSKVITLEQIKNYFAKIKKKKK